MPQVPYTPYPTAPVSESGPRLVHIDTPGAAFGATVGQALEGVGRVEEHAGNELFQRAVALQTLANETEAKEADAQYMIEAGKLHAQYSTLEGKAARDGLEPHMQALQDLRRSIREGLSNDAARRMYDGSSLQNMGRNIFNAAGHAATENKRYVLGASAARVAANEDQVAANPADSSQFEHALAVTQSEIQHQGEIKGQSQEQIDETKNKQTQKLWAAKIAATAKQAPWEAGKLLEVHRAELGGLYDKVEETVQQYQRTVGARLITQEVNADLRDPESDTKVEKPLADRLREAEDKAKTLNPKDQLLPDYVRSAVQADYAHHKAVIADTEFRNRNTVESGVLGGPKGEVPTTLDQLKGISPKVSAAFEALPEVKQRQVMKQLADNAKIPELERKRYEQSEEGLKRYQTLKGMAFNDPEGFLNLSIPDEKFTSTTRKTLVDLQERLKAKAAEDPRVGRALSHLKASMGQDMQSLGIYTRKGNEEDYDHFVGALQDALDVWQEAHKKPPNAKEIDEIGARLMQQQKKTWHFPWTSEMESGSALFQGSVPEETAAKIKAEITKAGGAEPTDEQIRRAYVRGQLLKLYGKTEKPSE